MPKALKARQEATRLHKVKLELANHGTRTKLTKRSRMNNLPKAKQKHGKMFMWVTH